MINVLVQKLPNDIDWLKVAKYVSEDITINEFESLPLDVRIQMVNKANEIHKPSYYRFTPHGETKSYIVDAMEIEYKINCYDPHSGDWTPYFVERNFNDVINYLKFEEIGTLEKL